MTDPTLWRVACPHCHKKITVSEKTQKLRHHTGIAPSPDGSRFRPACKGSGMPVRAPACSRFALVSAVRRRAARRAVDHRNRCAAGQAPPYGRPDEAGISLSCRSPGMPVGDLPEAT